MYSTTIIFNEHLRAQKPIPFPTKNEVQIKEKNSFLEQYGKPIMKVGLMSGLMYFGLDHVAFANEGLDLNEKMETLYFERFAKVAMWVLVVKGGWDTVNKAIKEDFDGAKKSFLQYVIIFAILLGLPTALREVESLFRGWS